ncbi:MAG: flavin reductase family protein [Mangrovicoccus sp.]|nr:flavin reductase family protein [Mangrovicoccus sp.]
MFYIPQNGHGLPHNPFNAIVAPRPIGWIATRSAAGQDNLAPYSFFNAVAYEPPQVMFASTSAKPDRDDTKDSVANIRETEVFCVNIPSYDLRDAVNASSQAYGREVDEFTQAGIARAECETIACSRVREAPAALECKLTQIVALPGAANFAVFGEVTGIHIRPDCLRGGKFDAQAYTPIARMGYRDYAKITKLFELTRPDE